MMRSLFSGVAGLRTHQSKMDVIGNNIANVNTIGFKSSAVTFQDIMYQTTSGASGATQTLGGVNAKQTGLGVTTGSTKISIEQSGAAQSTGQAFDLRFTDQSTTNFFVVNNGSENLFTRAGSFYVDGAGNLAMTSTGYMVMGWQYDEETGSIRRDVVSPLRIMGPDSVTSTPEYTTDMYVQGVLDKNDTDVSSEFGYINTLTVYDNLGYEYTVRFSTRLFDGDSQKYTTTLDSIKDSKGNDIYAQYVAQREEQIAANPEMREDGITPKNKYDIMSEIFGTIGEEKASFDLKNLGNREDGVITYTPVGSKDKYYLPARDPIAVENRGTADKPEYYVKVYPNKSPADDAGAVDVKLSDIFNASDNKIQNFLEEKGGTFSITTDGKLAVKYPSTNNAVNFSTVDGKLTSVGELGEKFVTLDLSKLNNLLATAADGTTGYIDGTTAFAPVNVDFSKLLAYDNGGTSTMGMDRGQVDNITLGTGRKLGTLTGLSVSNNGTIWGSYDNGTNKCLGQIPVARFSNASGLESLGNNVYAQTRNSGEFDGVGEDVTTDGGQINSGQLEMSNVDLSQEFTDMITTQRGFQANSRIITVSDTMLEELTNLKR